MHVIAGQHHAHRCGANHSFMPIVVEAISPRQFLTEYVKKWIE